MLNGADEPRLPLPVPAFPLWVPAGAGGALALTGVAGGSLALVGLGSFLLGRLASLLPLPGARRCTVVTALGCGGCFFVGLTRSMTGWVPGWAASSDLSVLLTVAACVLTLAGLEPTGARTRGPAHRTSSALVLGACAVTVLSAVLVQLQVWDRADAVAGTCLGGLGLWLAGRGGGPGRSRPAGEPPSSPWG